MKGKLNASVGQLKQNCDKLKDNGGHGSGRHFPPLHPRFSFKAVSYFLLLCGVIPSIAAFMNLLNRTRIMGKEYISSLEPPWILASNHLTLLDDLFIDPIIFFPTILKGYNFIPYHTPEERNFYKTRLIAWFLRQTKCIPLIRGQGLYQLGMERLIRAIRAGGLVHIFPEGTRTRNGEIGEPKPGIGRIVAETGAPVIPMYHQGLEKILPIGSGVPRFGREIRVSIGAPIKFDDLIPHGSNLEVWKAISQRVIDAIRVERERMNKAWGEKPVVVNSVRR